MPCPLPIPHQLLQLNLNLALSVCLSLPSLLPQWHSKKQVTDVACRYSPQITWINGSPSLPQHTHPLFLPLLYPSPMPMQIYTSSSSSFIGRLSFAGASTTSSSSSSVGFVVDCCRGERDRKVLQRTQPIEKKRQWRADEEKNSQKVWKQETEKGRNQRVWKREPGSSCIHWLIFYGYLCCHTSHHCISESVVFWRISWWVYISYFALIVYFREKKFLLRLSEYWHIKGLCKVSWLSSLTLTL